MIALTYLRVKGAFVPEIRRFGPKAEDHATIGSACPACGELFRVGEYTTLIALGPGDDPDEQAKAREDRVYNATAIEVHWKCATGCDD